MAIKGAFGLPFAEAEDFFLRKIHLPTAKYDDIKAAAHDRAFIVAGAAKADLLADLYRAIGDARTRGGLEEFRQHFEQIVFTHGWPYTGMDSAAGRAWRPRIIYETNLYTSYAAGRYRQLMDSPNLRYWLYRHDPLVTNPREQHLGWDGLILPRDHPFWKTHFPPNGWGCKCRVIGIEHPEDARAIGGDPDKHLPEGWGEIDPKTGAPKGIGKGWGYAPGANAATPLRELIEQKLFNLPAPIGAALWENLGPALALEQRLAWTSLVSEASTTMQASNHAALAHVAAPATVSDLAARGVPLKSADIWLRDAELIHALRETKAGRGAALTEAVWSDLPELLKTATPYLDTVDAGIVYVFEAPEGLGKVAVRVNYTSKVNDGAKRDKLTSNFIRTGGLIEPADIRAGGRYVPLDR